MKKLTHAMLDRMSAGAEIEGTLDMNPGGLECTEAEEKSIRKAMKSLGAIEMKDKSLELEIWSKKLYEQAIKGCRSAFQVKLYTRLKDTFSELKSTMSITLRQDARRDSLLVRNGDSKKSWYLNVSCNPTALFTGDNTFGHLRVNYHVQSVFNYALTKLSESGAKVGRLLEAVAEGEIRIHSLTFAVYSDWIKDATLPDVLHDQWYFMYETRLKRRQDKRYQSLLKELGIARSVGDQFDTSIDLDIYATNTPGDRHKFMHLCVYNKRVESEKKKELSPSRAEYLDHKIRFDLTVTSYYLERKWGLKPVMLKDVNRYVMKKWPNSKWKAAVRNLMKYAADRTCLFYMFVAPNPFKPEYKEMLECWEKERDKNKPRPGRKPKDNRWSKKLEDWATSIGLNLEISPLAHMIMWQGQAGLETNTEELTQMWLKGPEGQAKYLIQVGNALTRTKENRKLSSLLENLSLDFSAAPDLE